MMTYFEVRDRLNNLIEYRRLFKEYLSSPSPEKNLTIKAVRDDLELMACLASDSLRRVGMASAISPLIRLDDGKRARVDIIKTAFHDELVAKHGLDDGLVEKALDTGILKYRQLLWKQKLSLFNPLFWLYHFSCFLALLPLSFAQGPVRAQARMERSQWVQTYVALVQLAIFALMLGPLLVSLPWPKLLWVALYTYYQM